jgi:hypothetical protein
MSSDFKTVRTRDPTIGDITSDLAFAVKSGAASTTYQPYVATSSNNAVQVYNLQIPSENIIVGRDALVSCPMQFRINITAVPVGQLAIEWGKTCSLQAFPLSSNMTTASVTINNASTSISVQDILPALLRLNDNRELFRYNGMCPSLPDQEFGVYSDAFAANCSPLAGLANKSYDGCLAPRGAHPCVVQIDHYTVAAGGFVDHSPVSTNATDTWVVTVFTLTTEPIFVSPFIYGHPDNNLQGLLGVNSIAMTFNINTQLPRLISYAGPGTITLTPGVANAVAPGVWNANDNLFVMSNGVAAGKLNTTGSGPAILLKLLSAQPSDVLQTRNSVGYFDIQRHLTSNGAGIAINGSTTINSQNLQLNQLPDYFIICARKPMSSQGPADSSSFLTIRTASMNLNNMSGLLSGASPQDLWRLSVLNGSQQSWSEFSGFATVATADGQSKLVPTTGSMLVLSPTQMSIPDTLAPSSIGSFSFQGQFGVYNQFGVALPAVELCIITVNSGILTLQQGTSSFFTGVLTMDAVKLAKEQPEVQLPDRMVGGMLRRGTAVHPRLRGLMRGGESSAGALSAGAVRSRLAGMY